MPQFVWWAALLAGFIGAVAMSLMMKAAKTMGVTDMPAMPLVLGSMFTGDAKRAQVMGAFGHLIVMGTVVFGLLYAFLFRLVGSASWASGLTLGLIHGVVVGAVFMPMMGTAHPRMGAAVAAVGPETAGSQVRLVEPGFFGRNWGGVTPVGILVGHVIYGVVLALVYSWLA